MTMVRENYLTENIGHNSALSIINSIYNCQEMNQKSKRIEDRKYRIVSIEL